MRQGDLWAWPRSVQRQSIFSVLGVLVLLADDLPQQTLFEFPVCSLRSRTAVAASSTRVQICY